MTTSPISQAFAAALGLALSVSSASQAKAEPRNYEFRLVRSELKKGDGAIIELRLIDKRTGRSAPDAVIFVKRIDMAPDGMAMMASPLEAMPASEPGIYRFKTDLPMEGRWQLSLGAKVQGETGTVESKLILRAVK